MDNSKKAENYHRAMRPVETACRMAASDWVCIANPLVGWGNEGALIWRLRILLRHVGLAFRCWRVCGRRHILVREFSTLPLCAVCIVLLPLRRKLFFLLHHNAQWAQRSRVQRRALQFLGRIGFQMIALETKSLPDEDAAGLAVREWHVLLHPAPDCIEHGQRSSQVMLGVAGYNRAEKQTDVLLELLRSKFPNCKIRLGQSTPQGIEISGVEIVDTTDYDDYCAFLKRCDVLVQYGERESYLLRPSGPVAEALAGGTAVVVPDYPVLEHQISYPCRVGECFSSLTELPSAVEKAIEKVRAEEYDFEYYCRARSPSALAKQLDEISGDHDG